MRSLIIALAVFATTACKVRDSARLTASDSDVLAIEPVVANRLPIELLNRDEVAFPLVAFPPVVNVQSDETGAYGIRRIPDAGVGAPNLSSWVRPGDIAIQYYPLSTEMEGIHLLEEGMLHAAIVVRNQQRQERGDGSEMWQPLFPEEFNTDGAQLCHIDMPMHVSGCTWFQDDGRPLNWHFFRVIETDMKVWNPRRSSAFESTNAYESERYAVQLYQNGQLDRSKYDSLVYTEALAARSCAEVCEGVRNGECPPFYCSELPYTVASAAHGDTPLFPGVSLAQMMDKLGQKRRTGRFPNIESSERIRESLVAYVFMTGNVPEEYEAVIDYVAEQYLRNWDAEEAETTVDLRPRGRLAQGLDLLNRLHRKQMERLTGGKVPPSSFMNQAKNTDGKRVILYIGSIESAEGIYRPGSDSPTRSAQADEEIRVEIREGTPIDPEDLPFGDKN